MKTIHLIQALMLGASGLFLMAAGGFEAAGPEAIKKDKDFTAFIKQFEQGSLPYTISLEDYKFKGDDPDKWDANLLSKEKPISIAYDGFVPEARESRFSRMGSDDLYFEEVLASTNEFTAVIYKGAQPYSMSGINYFVLATYDGSGKMISHLHLGSCWSPEEFTSSTIDANMQITKIRYESIWEKDVYEHGFKGNKMTGQKEISKEVFSLASNGIILNKDGEAMLHHSTELQQKLIDKAKGEIEEKNSASQALRASLN